MADVLTAEEVQHTAELSKDPRTYDKELTLRVPALARSHEALRERFRESEIAVYDALALLGAARNERDAAVSECEDDLVYPCDCDDSDGSVCLAHRVLAAFDHASPAAACEHTWIDIRNAVVESGEWCSKCGEFQAGNENSASPAAADEERQEP